MKNRLKNLPAIILTLFILVAFIFTNLDSTAFARGSGTVTPSKSNPTTSKTTPKSGATSGSFSSPTKTPSSSSTQKSTTTPKSGTTSGSSSSPATAPSSNSQNSTTQPKTGPKSGSFSNSTKIPSSNSSVTNIYGGGGSSWHVPTIIFWPHRSYYYDSYGVSQYGYRSPSLLGILGDLIIIAIVIAIFMWFIKRRR